MSAGDLAINCTSQDSLENLLKLVIVNAGDCTPYIDCDNKDESLESLLRRCIVEDENGNLALNVCFIP